MMINLIYAFRGSNPQYLREFEKDFPHAEVVILNENYRSSHAIVSTANKIISENKHRRPKKMHAQYANEKKPILFFPYDEEEEATMIVTDIGEKLQMGQTLMILRFYFAPIHLAVLFLND